MNYRAYWNTAKSRRHKDNEDSLMFSEYTFMGDVTIRLIVITDGMGGMKNGDRASRNALTGFLEGFYCQIMKAYMKPQMMEYSLTYDIQKVQKAMVEAVKAANRSVLREVDRLEESGSTISAVCIMDDFAVTINVGDSPIYYYDCREKSLTLKSQLQTEAEYRADRGEYERYSREYYADDHRLKFYLGRFQEISEEHMGVYMISKLRPGDVILLGSDGSFGRMSEDTISLELEESLQGGEETEQCFLDNLFQIARAEKEDDQTAFVYIVEDEEEE